MNSIFKAGAIATMVFACVAANATTIKSKYTVNANKTDPGLKVNTKDHANNPFTYDLDAGDSTTFNLFNIWTDEGYVNADDKVARSVSVDFDFLLPQIGSSTVNGETDGVSFFGVYQEGKLTWNNTADFSYGPNNDGLIQVALSDETFNGGYFGLNDSFCDGATVQATLSLISDASPADVPEPGMLSLFALALLGLAVPLRRRRLSHRG